jgi:hypothetical protein
VGSNPPLARQAPGGWRPMHGCAAPGLLSARQGEVGWHAHAWQAALTLVSEADSGECRPSLSQAGTQGVLQQMLVPCSHRGHGIWPLTILIQLLRSCTHAAPIQNTGRHVHLISAELRRMSTLYAPSCIAHMKPPEHVRHPIFCSHAWSCAEWSGSLHWSNGRLVTQTA